MAHRAAPAARTTPPPSTPIRCAVQSIRILPLAFRLRDGRDVPIREFPLHRLGEAAAPGTHICPNPHPGTSGTTTCKPLAASWCGRTSVSPCTGQPIPQLLGSPQPQSSPKSTPSPGSRSKTSRSACAGIGGRRRPSYAARSPPSARMPAAPRRRRAPDRVRRPAAPSCSAGFIPFIACFWKKCWPPIPSGQRTSASGRPAMPGSAAPWRPRPSNPPDPAW